MTIGVGGISLPKTSTLMRTAAPATRPRCTDCSWVLDQLEMLARDRFGDLVERPYLTPIYLAQRV